MNLLFSQLLYSLPLQNDRIAIGSTDGIVVMGALIVLIILVPVVWRWHR